MKAVALTPIRPRRRGDDGDGEPEDDGGERDQDGADARRGGARVGDERGRGSTFTGRLPGRRPEPHEPVDAVDSAVA